MIFITLSGMSLLCASTQSLILEESACNTYRCSIVHEHQRFSVEDNTLDRHTNYPELEISFCVYMHMYLGAIDQPQVAGPLTGLGFADEVRLSGHRPRNSPSLPPQHWDYKSMHQL